jgi:hypothetical protein
MTVPLRFQFAGSAWKGRVAATAIVVAVALCVVYLVTTKRVPLIPAQPTSCTAAADKEQVPLSVSQAGIAATIAGVAAAHDLPERAVTIAYAAALQEAKLTNPDYGDRDSVGVFQQRPSEGWGTAAEIMNPVYASSRFFAALETVPNYLHMPVYVAAQAVQRSADGYAYDQYAGVGAQLASAFTGAMPHSVWCYYNGKVGKPRLTAAARALADTFGSVRVRRAGDPALAVGISAVGARKVHDGWAIATWLIAYAGTYGIAMVSYRGYEWVRGHGPGTWRRLPRTTPARADPTSVVFG